MKSLMMLCGHVAFLVPLLFAKTMAICAEEEEGRIVALDSNTLSWTEVFDQTFPATRLRYLNRYISYYLFWDFDVDQNRHFTFRGLEGSLTEQRSNRNEIAISPWVVRFPIQHFKRTKTWHLLGELLAERTGDTFHLREVKAIGMWRTDQTIMQSCVDENEVVAFVFLNSKYEKNDYGGVQLHAPTATYEVVHPKPGRIVIASCPTSYQVKPPSINSNGGHKVLVVRATRSDQTSQDAEKTECIKEDEFFAKLSELEHGFPAVFYGEARQINPADFLVKQVSLSGGMGVHVFDGALEKSIVDAFVDFIVANATYQDSEPGEHSDNVYWVSGYHLHTFVKTNIWAVAQQLIEFVTGETGHMPYDVTCNLIRGSDHSKIHLDCSHSDDEYTFLLYLNKDWKVEYYGETVFFDEMLEPVLAIKPKYGRIAVFNCAIPHSARPPSSLINGARFTFAVKVSTLDRFKTTDDIHDGIDTLKELITDTREEDLSDVDMAAVNEVLVKIDQGKVEPDELRKCIQMFEDRETEEIFHQI